MTDNTMLIDLEPFVKDRIKVIRNREVFIDFDLAELFEIDTETIHKLVEAHPDLFPEEALLALSKDERMHFNGAQYSFSDSGIFALAGLIKTKRSIRIYVKLIELLVNKLQGKANELTSVYQHTDN